MMGADVFADQPAHGFPLMGDPRVLPVQQAPA